MHQKIRIAHITQAMGGVKTHIKYILDFADPEAFAFEVIAPYDKDFIAFAKQRNIRYHVLHMERNISPIKDFVAFWKLFFLLRKLKLDVVHVHSAKAGVLGRLVCKLQGQPSAFTPNGFSYLGAKGIKRSFFLIIEAVFKNYATKLFAVSHSEAHRALYEIGFAAERIAVIENAIKPPGSSAPAAAKEVGIISTIGRLTAQKNLVRFVEIAHAVLQKHPHLEFRILGAGYHDDQKEAILSLIKRLRLEHKVRIIEWSYEMSVNDYLSQSQIYLSTAIFEGLPYAILEAMSLGIPCVASACDGNMDIIEHGTDGFLCNSLNDFEKTIFTLIENEALRLRISRAAVHKVNDRFDIRNRSLILSKEYRKILQS